MRKVRLQAADGRGGNPMPAVRSIAGYRQLLLDGKAVPGD